MSDKDTKQEPKEEPQEDLELQDEEADEVKGGSKKFFGADKAPDARYGRL